MQFFLFGRFRKTDFHIVQNLHLLLVDQYWPAIGCLFHTTFKMERQSLMSINNSNRDWHFWYELSLHQWMVVISGKWASNAMCNFSMRSLLMQSKDGLIVTRQAPNNFLCSKPISIDSALWITKMIFHILPQLVSHYLCQLSLILVMLRYVS